MATYAIGDVQGCFDQLQDLLALIQFSPTQDYLWFVGDLVNRGPQSLETLRFVKSLGSRAVTVLGNHDLHLLAINQGIQKVKSQDTLQSILDAEDKEELLTWLRHLPFIHYDEELRAIMVHAGLPPCWDLQASLGHAKEVEELLRSEEEYKNFLTYMYGNTPKAWDELLHGWARSRFIANAFTRMRYCNSEGHLYLKEKGAPSKVGDTFIPWFTLREAPKDYRLIFGHWASLNGECDVENIIALDTGCVWGGKLTAYCLETQEFFSVYGFKI